MNIITLLRVGNLKNKRGSVLIFSMLVLSIFMTLTAGYLSTYISELNLAKRDRDSAIAFWAAEAGLQEFISNNEFLTNGPQTLYFGGHPVSISKDDTDTEIRRVTASADVNGVTRTLQMDFPAQPYYALNNTLSTGGDLEFIVQNEFEPETGYAAGALSIWGFTKITGEYFEVQPPIGVFSVFIENLETGVAEDQTTLQYPDADGNGAADQFSDFKSHNQQILANLDPSEYVYIQAHDDSTHVIIPNDYYGKKMIYIEGDDENQGNVEIFFAADLNNNLNLTIATTGTVSYIQPALNPTGSKLNTVSWGDFNQSIAVDTANHEGITYTHGQANFNVWGAYNSKGPIVANEGFYAESTRHWEKLAWANLVEEGLPAGFTGLIAGKPNGYQTTPTAWREL